MMKSTVQAFAVQQYGKIRSTLLAGLCLAVLIAAWPSLAQAQQARKVGGVVRDEAGEALAGVSVQLKGTTTRAATNAQGRYEISAPAGGGVLVFSFIGMQTRELTLGSGNTYDIQLQPAANELDEVRIYTGYMTQKKADLTGAVTAVTRDDFVKNPSANVLRSLQGKVPGVNITTNGNPAEEIGIQVRGVTSINSSPPLIVLDGQPVSINLRDINPNDIEGIQFLKDASSASIYGSRAAGGVILINTKKGRKGENEITYETYMGLQKITGVPDMLNAEQYGRGLWQATVNDGIDPATIRIFNYDWNTNAQGIPVLNRVTPVPWLNNQKTMPSANTNWFDEGTRTGLQQNHQVTISGGRERSSSLLSLNYYNNDGTQITSQFRRYSARFNNEYDLIKGRLTVGENLTLTNLKVRSVNSTYQFLVMPPNVPVYDNNGGWGGSAMGLGMDDFNNPIRELELSKDNGFNFMKVLGNAYVNLKILDNLNFRSQFGVDYSMSYLRDIQRKWAEGGGRGSDINGVRQTNGQNLGYTWTNTATYNLTLGKSVIDMLAGTEIYKFVAEDINSYRDGLEAEDRDYAYLGAAAGDRKEQFGGGDERRLASFFGKVNYAFASRYLLSATIRQDGASVFGANNRYAVFPAFSAGWRISEEKFMKSLTAINDLKIRASWGQNGNSEPLGAGRLYNIYATDFNGTSYPIAGNPSGSIPSGLLRRRLGNADLRWEATTQVNLGVDFALLKNRLSGSFDWFDKTTTGMLFEPPYPAALGEGGYRFINAGNMNNKGVELVLSWAGRAKDFSYNITGNMAAYRNQIVSVPESFKYVYAGNGLLDNIIGRSRNSHYGLVADGIFKTQEEVDNSARQNGKGLGRIRYKDLDGDGVINEVYDRAWLGTSDPKLTAGLNFAATYKNFDITFFFQGFFGNTVYNAWKESSDFWNIGIQKDRNHPVRILDAWSPLNPNSDIPALSRGDANGEKRFSSYYLENGSYVKLRTLDIGYSFPAQLVQRWSMKRLRVYVSGQNLLTLKKTWGDDRFTAGDPENPGTGYPMPVTGFIGLNVTF
ncbi:TonB-dependent receptor [Pedobacter yulinensis]|uniref:TonB-dependent receptor n=1 Tax=Pedobacter yulinensis TaxID=2126353 RepID=A0A2T3HKT1_9SPHI|nr:TonB-dependent receptor [Pedobacter yulinensis]PST83068.1 TonB-dependent receptor [Pedobacter yulinensis]